MKKIYIGLIISLSLLLFVFLSCDSNGALSNGDKLEIVKNNATEYIIVRPSTGGIKSSHDYRSESEAAAAFRDIVERMTGVSLDMKTYKEKPTVKTIIIGKTANEDSGLYEINRDELGDSGYIIKTMGDDILIAGGNAEGTWSGVIDFINDYLKYDVINDENIPSVKEISVPKKIDIKYKSEKKSEPENKPSDNLYPVKKLSLNGGDISEYIIITSEEYEKT